MKVFDRAVHLCLDFPGFKNQFMMGLVVVVLPEIGDALTYQKKKMLIR